MIPSKCLLGLPREVLLHIITFLHHQQIARCRQVCREMNAVICGSVALQYQMELQLEDFENGPAGSLSTSDRLKLLVERRNRWLTLDWTQTIAVMAKKIIPESPLPYELQGGSFYNVTSLSGVVTMNETRLPSATNPEVEYHNKDLDGQYADLTTDPSQDLMVMLDMRGRLHISTISHGVHPLAKEPLLRPEGTPHVQMTGLHIAHDLVALIEWTENISVTIWNWMTGRMILHGTGATLPYLATGLVWLSHRTFVIADAGKHELVLFSLSDVDCVCPEVPRKLSEFLPCTRLRLPQLHVDWHVSYLALDTTPLLASVPSGQPFAPMPESNIIVFISQYATMDHTQVTGRFIGFVHNRHLSSHIPTWMPQNIEDVKAVHWAEWGPSHTRIMPNLFSRTAYARYVHGQKVVFSAIGGLYNQWVFIFDFNVHRKRIFSAQNAETSIKVAKEPIGLGSLGVSADSSMELVELPHTFKVEDQEGPNRRPSPFAEIVETCLPFVQTCRAIPRYGRPSQLMMDGERLIELNLQFGSQDALVPWTDSVRVYTF